MNVRSSHFGAAAGKRAGRSAVRPQSNGATTAFTLVEMLTVIAIITVMALVAIPALKGFGSSNAIAAATRQMLDDIGYARQKAINDRTKVYMVFLPPQFWAGVNAPRAASLNADSSANLDDLITGQYTSYALFSFRGIGDQPGHSRPRYLTAWRELPDGMMIETNKFTLDSLEFVADVNDPARLRTWAVRGFPTNEFPFPPTELTNTAAGAPIKFHLPYIGFDAQGKLLPRPGQTSPEDEFIPLVKGSIFPPRDANGKALRAAPDVVQGPYRELTRTNYLLIHVDWLTGRARIEKQELQ